MNGHYKKITYLLLLLVGAISVDACAEFKLGVENISDPAFRAMCKNMRLGLITNQTGVDQSGQRTIDLLLNEGFNLTYLFAPEHGLDGKSGAGVKVHNTKDKKTNLPVVSLYGHGTGKMIPADVMDNIDAIIFDIQDSGMRHYTYISTLYHVMKTAADHNKHVIVLDRPNPLGALMEGPVVAPGLKSFVSIAHIPLRHGMTVGELAWYFNMHELKKAAKLHVVKMKNYDRRVGMGQKLLAPLSPGLRTVQSCNGYSFLGLIGEVRPFAIGLRTQEPYHCLMVPKRIAINNRTWAQLAKLLRSFGINSVQHEYVDPKTKTHMHGLRLHIDEINEAQGFNALVTIFAFFKSQGVKLTFSRLFDQAVGTQALRLYLKGEAELAVLAKEVNDQLKAFHKRAQAAFMYHPLPSLVLMD
jgi:uncharacterized protein YbbC (DUF1343 family)